MYEQFSSEEILELSKTHLGCWIIQLRHFPDETLGRGVKKPNRDLFSSFELLKIYDPNKTHKANFASIYNLLLKYGFKQVHGGKAIRLTERTCKYFIIRNTKRLNVQGTRKSWLHPPYLRGEYKELSFDTASYLEVSDHILKFKL